MFVQSVDEVGLSILSSGLTTEATSSLKMDKSSVINIAFLVHSTLDEEPLYIAYILLQLKHYKQRYADNPKMAQSMLSEKC